MEEGGVIDSKGTEDVEIAKSKWLNWFWTIGLIAVVLIVSIVIIAFWVVYSKPVVLERSFSNWRSI